MANDELVDLAVDYLKEFSAAASEEDRKSVREHKFVKEHCAEVAELTLRKGDTADSVTYNLGLLHHYTGSVEEKKPLSIAIFGPPGSGKSTFVEKLCDHVDDIYLAKTINLTQVANTQELADALLSVVMVQGAAQKTPVIFFDEFDSMCEGAPFGWLSWFLAPMEDGKFLINRSQVPVGKAVFVFAGGTAKTLEVFNEQAKLNQETYRARKVPDFVSRLRGAINIEGVNGHGNDRIIRRALTLSFFLQNGKADRFGEKEIKKTLRNGFFVHGARSLKTYVDVKLAGNEVSAMPSVIRRQHFSRGVFDGVTVGISAGLGEDEPQGLSRRLTEELLQGGATLAYAGAFFKDGTLHSLQTQAQEAPPDIEDEAAEDDVKEPRIVNWLGNPASHNAETVERGLLHSEHLTTISDQELDKLDAPVGAYFPAFPEDPNDKYDPKHHAAWAISQFRLRSRVVEMTSALIAFGGKDSGRSWGRMSGIAEEVMLALAMRKPVYVLGGAKGAAKAVGELLGLGEAPVSIENLLSAESGGGLFDELEKFRTEFNIPGVPDSPFNLEEVRKFIFERGIGTDAWIGNGLSKEENRILFELDPENDLDEISRLTVKGLSRIDWKIKD